MKYKKIIISLLATAGLVGIFGFQGTAYAFGEDICHDINDWNWVGGALDCGSQGDIVSFSGFKGGLEAPSGEGIDATLTRAKTAREFVVNTVNFALTFLGILAVVIVIYGGFLYITAAGNEEQSKKGKQALTYAVIGILIIIASFAIVNTLLTFGGGSATDRGGGAAGGDARGVGQEGSNAGQQNIYGMGAVQINMSLNEFIKAYKTLLRTTGLEKKLRVIPAPAVRENNKNYLNDVSAIVSEITGATNSLSKTNIAARNLLEGWIAQTKADDLMSAKYEDGQIKDRFIEQLDTAPTIKQAIGDDFKKAINELIGSDGTVALGSVTSTATAAVGMISGTVSNPPAPVRIQGKLKIVRKVLGAVATLTVSDATTSALQRGLITEKDIQRAFEGIDPNTTVGEIFDQAVADLTEARALADNPDQPDKVEKVVKSLYTLYIVVKDIKFVYVKIKASSREGNAPLIVELNGLDSRDPTGETIDDSQYTWDPDGDGETGVKAGGKVTCNEETGRPTIACTYNQPGTYLVGLQIASKDAARIGAGEASLSITVNPSVARISLKAKVGSAAEEDLRKYTQDSKGQYALTVNKGEFQVTTEEAKTSGVSFDASESVGGSGESLKTYEWTFGDGKPPPTDKTNPKVDNPPHKYDREGSFPLTLEVTDRGNRKDRAIVNVVVASIAARIGTEKTVGEPDELFEFDGSLSKSDHGSIGSYKWEIFDTSGKSVIDLTNVIQIIGDPNASVLRVKFKQPGTYRVELTVSDGSKTGHTKIENVGIKSRKPRANIAVRACPEDCPDPSQPAIVEFNAGLSFDPDKSDVLNYDWNFFNELGDKLEPGANLTILDNAPLSGKQAKKLRVKFQNVGKYKAVLKVDDSHEDVAIRQEDTTEKVVEVKSIVEAKWQAASIQDASQGVVQLKDGKATVDFTADVKNATKVSCDFGDGTTDESPVFGDGPPSRSHDYTKAGSYLIKLKFSSDQGNGENTLTKRVYVRSGDSPLAVIEAYVDNTLVALPETSSDNPKPALEIMRGKIITFDAGKSVNSANESGQKSNLKYSWDFGDSKRSREIKVGHSYEDISLDGSPYKVTLTIQEGDDKNKTTTAIFYVNVISFKPQISNLSLEKKTVGDTAPLDVGISAEGATDPDGRITNYQFWYYDPADNEKKKMSVIDTPSDHATLTVETSGAEGEGHEYYFCANVTDNENTTNECGEMFDESQLPHLIVKNGPNKAPTASFSPDRTYIKVGESITFTSSSTDEDGKIVKYAWDVEGDGFQNDNPTEQSSITHQYTRKSPKNGYRVKLKVIDDRNAAGYSKEIPIIVEPKSNPPQANFTYQTEPGNPSRVRFSDASIADVENGAKLTKWSWDFDVYLEPVQCVDPNTRPSYCDGNKTNDVESTDQYPVHDFPAGTGTYSVRLMVEDSDGNVSEPFTGSVDLRAGGTGAVGTSSIVSAELNAISAAGRRSQFEQLPGCQPVGSPACLRKTLHLPSNSCGEKITFLFGDSRGQIDAYNIDKNVYFDSVGDGDRANNNDNQSKTEDVMADSGMPCTKCWTTSYQRFERTGLSSGNFCASLTARVGGVIPGPLSINNFSCQKSQSDPTRDFVYVVFDQSSDPSITPEKCGGSILGGSLLSRLGTSSIILLGIVSGVIVILIVWGAASFLKRGHQREI